MEFSEKEKLILSNGLSTLIHMLGYPLKRIEESKSYKKLVWKDAKKLNPHVTQEEYFEWYKNTTEKELQFLEQLKEKLEVKNEMSKV